MRVSLEMLGDEVKCIPETLCIILSVESIVTDYTVQCKFEIMHSTSFNFEGLIKPNKVCSQQKHYRK